MGEPNRASIIERVTAIAERIGDPKGIEIVEVQLLGAGAARVLRLYIDKPEGVSHADCEFISDELGGALDTEDVIPGDTYTLEVSSPGVERRLSRPKDFERFAGSRIKLSVRQPVDGQRHWEGVLRGFQAGAVMLEAAPGRQISIPLDQIQKANLKFQW